MKKILFISTGVIVLAVAVWYFFLKEPTFNATDGYLVNLNDKGVIIEGYDPVAYFTDNMPVKGNEQFKFKKMCSLWSWYAPFQCHRN